MKPAEADKILAPPQPLIKPTPIVTKKIDVLVVKPRQAPKIEEPMWTPSRESESLLFLQEELKKHNKNDERKSRAVKTH